MHQYIKRLHYIFTPPQIERDEEVTANYYILFNLVCISLLIIFCILNFLTDFYTALYIDLIGIALYSIGLVLFKKNLPINIAGGLYIFTCSFILLSQSVILEHDAYHNMFFYPPVALFCFTLFSKKSYTYFFFSLTVVSAILSHFIPKYFNTTIWFLSESEKDIFITASLICSLIPTYKIVSIVFDQREEAFKNLISMNKKLDEYNEKNKKLLQLIVHDISSPLHNIHLVLSRADKMEDDFSKRITRITKPAIGSIKEIIESTREMMAIEDGIIKVKISHVDLIEEIDNTIRMFEESLQFKNIDIQVINNANHSPLIQADKRSLSGSVLNNLISNAIKFSHPNSVITLEIFDTHSEVILKISDQGIGIPEKIIQKIFRTGEVTSREGTLGERGTGYGLPIVHTYIKEYKGRITCTSVADQGTTFTLFFLK